MLTEEEKKAELKRRRKIRRIKRKIRRYCILLAILLLLICTPVMIIKIQNFKSSADDCKIDKVSSNNKNESIIEENKTINEQFDCENIVIPDYINRQFLPIGFARSGKMLDSINNIVIHYVGNPMTTAQNNHDFFADKNTEVCSHFIVGLDGEIIQCLPLNERSAASNHRNKDTISIEVCHNDSSGRFNAKTYNSVIRLCAWLCSTFNLKSTDCIRHYDITGKECPKYYVKNPEEWKVFLKDVEKALINIQ